MNSKGYTTLLFLIMTSILLVFGFNNCSGVDFKQLQGGENNKVGVLDTSDIDRSQITEENSEEMDRITEEIKQEPSGDGDGDGDKGNRGNHSGEHNHDDHSQLVCDEFENGAGKMKVKDRQMICHSTSSGRYIQLCLPAGAVNAHLAKHKRKSGHEDIMGPCFDGDGGGN